MDEGARNEERSPIVSLLRKVATFDAKWSGTRRGGSALFTNSERVIPLACLGLSVLVALAPLSFSAFFFPLSQFLLVFFPLFEIFLTGFKSLFQALLHV